MRKAMKISSFLVAVGALAFTALPAFAAPTAISDSLTVYAPNGSVYAQILLSEDQENGSSPQNLYSIKQDSVLKFNTAQIDNATTLVARNGDFSDQFGVYQFNLKKPPVLGFMSDTESNPLFLANPKNLTPEGNGIFDATKYLDPSLVAAGWKATFVSDAETPEPASLTLLGLGAVGLFGYGWRRRKLALA